MESKRIPDRILLGTPKTQRKKTVPRAIAKVMWKGTIARPLAKHACAYSDS